MWGSVEVVCECCGCTQITNKDTLYHVFHTSEIIHLYHNISFETNGIISIKSKKL